MNIMHAESQLTIHTTVLPEPTNQPTKEMQSYDMKEASVYELHPARCQAL